MAEDQEFIYLTSFCVKEKLLIFYICEIQSVKFVVKGAAELNLVSEIKRDLPKFGTVLLRTNWSNLRRKYLNEIPTDIKALSCGPKT